MENVLDRPVMPIISIIDKEPGFIDFRNTARKAIESVGCLPYLNNETIGTTQGIFNIVLADQTKCVAGVVIIGQEKSQIVIDESHSLLKSRIPLFVFVKRHNGKFSQNSKNIVQEISNDTFKYDCSLFNSNDELYKSVVNRLSDFILTKALRTDSLRPYYRNTVYEICVKMLSKPTDNVILSQLTSTLSLGANLTNKNENIFYNLLLSCAKSGSCIIHGLDVNKTCFDMKTGYYDIRAAKNNMLLLQEDYKKNKYFKFFAVDPKESSPSYLITDNEALWIYTIGGNRYYLHNTSISKNDINQAISALSACSRMSFDEIINLYPIAV